MNNPVLTESIGVYFMDMSSHIEEHVVFNEDGSYVILLNSRLNWERQMLAYQHALKHIAEGDFNKDCADAIEKAM